MSAAEMPESTPALDQARMFVASGWRPFPCEYGGKRPAVGIKWGTATASVPTDKTLRWWFGRDPVNVGIAAKGSSLVILDEDVLGAMERLCADYGRSVPGTYRVRTAKGWHWYFTAPSDHEIGNAPGILADYGFDVRGGKGDGGYVIAAGSLHESGHVYKAEDPGLGTLELPDWLCQLLLADEEPPAPPGKPSDDRRYTDEQAAAWVKRYAIDPLRGSTEGGRNNALNTAAVVTGHFVPTFYTEDEATAALTGIAEELGLDATEIGPTIRSGLRKGMGEQYDRVEGRDPFASASDSSGSEPDAFETALQRERIRRQVRELLDAENRPALREMSFAEFLASPAPSYLVPKMLYRDGLSVVFGAPGAAKSFLMLDIALCLATGTPWRGRSIGRGRVHYVMAEGQATNTLRTQAWLHHRGVDGQEADGWFVAFTEPVMLTESGIVDYLVKVERDQPDLIILDTKNLMFEGKEAQGDDYGRMLRALHRIRTVAGGAAVVLIDHSGLGDDTRTRGSNAQKGGVETEIRVTTENGVRRAEVTRDKSGQSGTEWLYRLTQIDAVTRPPDVDAPAVCEALDPSEVTAGNAWGERFENWNDPNQPALPDDVSTYNGAGCTAIRAMARFMRYSAGGSVGFSMAQARQAVRETYLDEKGKPMWSRNTVDRAWNALVDLNRLTIAESGGSTARSLWETRPGDPN